MTSPKVFLIIGAQLLTTLTSWSQFRIQGQVFDATTNTPLPGANVFLASTTHGVSTDAVGAFTLSNLPAVHYQLVVSFIGYKTETFDVVPGQPVTYKVLLELTANELNEVVIRARKSSRAEWISNFGLFKEHFIGKSENARWCTFEDPKVIEFDFHNQILTAVSDVPVVINNQGLGYRLKFLIQMYEYNSLMVTLRYQGQVVYERLEPADQEQRELWARSRLKAYYGSEMHFFRSLYQRVLFDEGFYYNLVHMPKGAAGMARVGVADKQLRVRSEAYNGKIIKVKTLDNYKLILDSATSTLTEPVFKFNDELEVEYIHEKESYEYTKERFPMGRATSVQMSVVELRKPYVVIEPNGNVFPQDGVETSGYWSWELVSESLPFDYDPEADKAVVGISSRPSLDKKSRR